MHCEYLDIRDRIDVPPLWWDEHAVPRYCAFHPRAVANIYATEVALIEVACQACGALFRVAVSAVPVHGDPTLAEHVHAGTLYYGDPPNVGCCPAIAAAMHSEPRAVLEFWARPDGHWLRYPEHEVVLQAPWGVDEERLSEEVRDER
ncbi:MAG TPA: hypothetical protein VFQ22_07960 [Longimicrobiales bacterium]|nr:hypothetical protein [Longimicrobiales bacterium]